MAEPRSTKKSTRFEGRLAAVQFGYQEITQKDVTATDLPQFWELRPIREKARLFAEELIKGVLTNKEQIDAKIATALENYNLQRISPVEHAILRVFSWEVFHSLTPPPTPVAIDQAIELARHLGGLESAKFVHGVADKMVKKNAS